MDELLKLFLPLDELEQQQKRTGKFIKEFEEEAQELNQFVIKDQLFYDTQNIIIRKHRRFAPYPLHSHQFLEFNYMLSGESKQIINGNEVVLKEKQVLLLDTNSEHELAPLGEKDILINFLFRTKDLNIDILKRINSENTGLTYDFIMNAVLGSDYHDNYLILDIRKYAEIQATLEQMILEFLARNRLTSEILTAQSQVLFLQLSRVYHSQLAKIYSDISNADLMIETLYQIENDYRELTLEKLAAKLGYNKNYLSNAIKKKTGKTFKELLTEQRLNEAHRLILATNLPIETVADYVGYSNRTQFYKKYKDYFGTTPNKVRKLR